MISFLLTILLGANSCNTHCDLLSSTDLPHDVVFRICEEISTAERSNNKEMTAQMQEM